MWTALHCTFNHCASHAKWHLLYLGLALSNSLKTFKGFTISSVHQTMEWKIILKALGLQYPEQTAKTAEFNKKDLLIVHGPEWETTACHNHVKNIYSPARLAAVSAELYFTVDNSPVCVEEEKKENLCCDVNLG